jgi:hypothetical protein
MVPGCDATFTYAVRVRVTRAARLVSVAGVVAAVYACRAPTEMTIRVTTTVSCKTLKGVGIAAAPTSADAEHRVETKFYAAETMQCDSDSVVGTLVLTPGATSFSVIVVAGVDSDVTSCAPPLYKGCIVARRRLAFVDHKSLDVPIALTRDCLDVPCNTDTSCVHGDCKSVETTCNDASCTQVGVSQEGDGGTEDGGGMDGGRMDGGDIGDGATSDGDVQDATIDAAMTDAAFTQQWQCFSSPACPGPPGMAAPCMCFGPVMVDAGFGPPTTEMMTVDCPFGAQRCNCIIENRVANTITNNGFCSTGQFGSCCNH